MLVVESEPEVESQAPAQPPLVGGIDAIQIQPIQRIQRKAESRHLDGLMRHTTDGIENEDVVPGGMIGHGAARRR